jgi:hypothetical protein
MLRDSAFDGFFLSTVQALKPYLGDIICIGGCANALYRIHETASSPVPDYLGTKDIDWAVPTRLAERGGKSLSEFMKKAGFVEELHGTQAEPVVKYRSGNEAVAAEIEFLCPLSGMRGGRQSDNSAVEVQTGLMAQPLRYMDILTKNPWMVDLGKAPEFRKFKGVLVRVPNPTAYMVQKILIRDQRRKPESKAKDCYYIYEVSVVFRDNLVALREEYEKLQSLPAPWLKRFAKNIRILFKDEHSEGPTSALDIYESAGMGAPQITADMIQRAVGKMLDSLGIP